VVAVRGDEPPVIVELKTTLNIELILQAADRLKLSPSVYIAFPKATPQWKRHWKRVRGLCQRLGVGIITLDGKALKVSVRLDPKSYQPRGNTTRTHRLLSEFEKRVGDPNKGGVNRTVIMTAYRQDVLRCVAALKHGPLKLSTIREQTEVTKVQSIMQKDHYRWFERVSRGWYQLSPNGIKAADQNSDAMQKLLEAQPLIETAEK
jgi:hypothetical protein